MDNMELATNIMALNQPRGDDAVSVKGVTPGPLEKSTQANRPGNAT